MKDSLHHLYNEDYPSSGRYIYCHVIMKLKLMQIQTRKTLGLTETPGRQFKHPDKMSAEVILPSNYHYLTF